MNEDKTKAQWGFPILLGFILAAFIIAFGVQTWLFVDSFMPHNQLYLKIMTVVSFDGMALVYFLFRLFYRHWNQDSRHAVDTMFFVCVIGSLLCTVLWTFLQAVGFEWSSVPQLVLWVAYGIVTVAIPVNALVIYYIVDKEWTAYKAKSGSPQSPIRQPIQQPPALPTFTAPSTLDWVPPQGWEAYMAQQRQQWERERQTSTPVQNVPSNGTKEPQTSPLAEMALGQMEEIQLPKPQDQNQQNGKK